MQNFIYLKTEIPLPRQRSPLFQKVEAREGVGEGLEKERSLTPSAAFGGTSPKGGGKSCLWGL